MKRVYQVSLHAYRGGPGEVEEATSRLEEGAQHFNHMVREGTMPHKEVHDLHRLGGTCDSKLSQLRVESHSTQLPLERYGVCRFASDVAHDLSPQTILQFYSHRLSRSTQRHMPARFSS